MENQLNLWNQTLKEEAIRRSALEQTISNQISGMETRISAVFDDIRLQLQQLCDSRSSGRSVSTPLHHDNLFLSAFSTTPVAMPNLVVEQIDLVQQFSTDELSSLPQILDADEAILPLQGLPITLSMASPDLERHAKKAFCDAHFELFADHAQANIKPHNFTEVVRVALRSELPQKQSIDVGADEETDDMVDETGVEPPGTNLGMVLQPVLNWDPGDSRLEEFFTLADVGSHIANVAGCWVSFFRNGEMSCISYFSRSQEEEALKCLNYVFKDEVPNGSSNLGNVSDILDYCNRTVFPEMQTPKLLWVKENLTMSWSMIFRGMNLSDCLSYRAIGDDSTTVCKWTYLGHGLTHVGGVGVLMESVPVGTPFASFDAIFGVRCLHRRNTKLRKMFVMNNREQLVIELTNWDPGDSFDVANMSLSERLWDDQKSWCITWIPPSNEYIISKCWVQYDRQELGVEFVMVLDSYQLDAITYAYAYAYLNALAQGMWIHAYTVRNYTKLNGVLGTSLVDMYAKFGYISIPRDVFKTIPSRDVFAYTSLNFRLANNDESITTLEVYSRMEEDGVRPNEVTFICAMSAYNRAGVVDEGLRIFRSMKDVYGIEQRPQSYGCLVDLLGRDGMVEETEKVVRSGGIDADEYMVVAMVNACRVHGNGDQGKELIHELLSECSLDHNGVRVLANIYAALNKWEVTLPAEEVPPELSGPALGINFTRDGMAEKDRLGLDKANRKWLFNMFNDQLPVFESLAVGESFEFFPAIFPCIAYAFGEGSCACFVWDGGGNSVKKKACETSCDVVNDGAKGNQTLCQGNAMDEKSAGNRKGLSINSKRDLLRQKAYQFEKHYQGRLSKGAFKAKVAAWGSMVLDKSLREQSGFASIAMNEVHPKLATSAGGSSSSLVEGKDPVSALAAGVPDALNTVLANEEVVDGSLLVLGPVVDYYISGNSVFDYNFGAGVIMFILLSCSLAVFCNVSQYLCIGCSSTVSFQVLGHMKIVCVLVVGWLLLDSQLTFKNMLGMIVAVVDMMVYSWAMELKKQMHTMTTLPHAKNSLIEEEFSLLEVMVHVRLASYHYNFLFLDSRGRGSSSGGGNVMTILVEKMDELGCGESGGKCRGGDGKSSRSAEDEAEARVRGKKERAEVEVPMCGSVLELRNGFGLLELIILGCWFWAKGVLLLFLATLIFHQNGVSI